MDYADFFSATTGHPPLPYQERFRATSADRIMLKVPTGLGKTDAVLIAWLHRRITEPQSTPRRLIWCLPGRALTEQLFSIAKHRVATAGMANRIRVCRLMGGSNDNDLTLTPEEPAILVGTQDILLSRALNRGYARRPYRWPIDFALLSNDCYWVLDEVQMLGDGLSTSTQLAAFRESFGSFGLPQYCWISATFDPAWLRTVDFIPLAATIQVVELDDRDRSDPLVQSRTRATKALERAHPQCRLPEGMAHFLGTNHRPGTLSLVVVNTVTRAQEIFGALENRSSAEVVLLHSRFRATDRAAHLARLTAPLPREGRIVIATQVIEAGIDISANLLLTDVAPYPALVQRFGRVNRYGERTDSRIFWVDYPLTGRRKSLAESVELKTKDLDQISPPYTGSEIRAALETLQPLRSAAPDDLPPVAGAAPWEHVLRRADLLDLFDTTSDLSGNEIDISRFVRSGEDRDVYVAWRNWPGGPLTEPPGDLEEIEDAELCPAPIGEVRDFAKKRAMWTWSILQGRWTQPEHIYPGNVLLIRAALGGYTVDRGWLPESKEPVTPISGTTQPGPEALDDDHFSYVTYRRSLRDHTEDVCDAMRELLVSLSHLGLESYHGALGTAARKHDWGKAHPVMQETLHNSPGPYEEVLAKQVRGLAARRHSVPFFRHELASALAMVIEGDDDLAAYIVAAHHGRVRVTIRSMPGERDSGTEIARGIGEGDQLQAVDLGGGVASPPATLTLKPMVMGKNDTGESWTDRILRLRDTLGPFRLSYLEMLLRSADERASQRDSQG
jgi:CRISPR-associated endonuclease/helicase Cas3